MPIVCLKKGHDTPPSSLINSTTNPRCNNGRIMSCGMFPGSQHFEVKGCAGAPGWGL